MHNQKKIYYKLEICNNMNQYLTAGITNSNANRGHAGEVE